MLLEKVYSKLKNYGSGGSFEQILICTFLPFFYKFYHWFENDITQRAPTLQYRCLKILTGILCLWKMVAMKALIRVMQPRL